MNPLDIMKLGHRFVASVVALSLTTVPVFGQAAVGGLTGNMSGEQTQKLAELRRHIAWKERSRAPGEVQQNQPSSVRVEEGYIAADDGARLFYRKVGSGPQTVIIPLGFMLFDDFRRLAAGRTLIFYDMRNRGRSDPVADGANVTIHKDVEDLEKIRRHFRLDKVSLIGESYLGLMVVMYAMHYPQYVDRIIQIGAVPRKFGTEYPGRLTAQDKEPAIDPVEEQKLRKLEQEGYHKSNPKDYCEKEWLVVRTMLVGKREDAHKVGPGYCDMPNEWPVNLARHFEHHFTSVQRLDIPKAEIAKVKHPALTIHGTRDRNAPYGSGREWAVTLPGARLITVEGAAHLPWIEAPEVVFSSIDAFLRGKWPAEAEKITALDMIGKKVGDQPEIRIANRSRAPMENVRVQFPSQTEVYGTIPPNGVTDYRVVKKAYRYALIEAVVAGKPARLIPIDYVGESELKAGRYTYVLTIDARPTSKVYGLRLKLRKE